MKTLFKGHTLTKNVQHYNDISFYNTIWSSDVGTYTLPPYILTCQKEPLVERVLYKIYSFHTL